MRTLFRLTALLISLGALALWLIGGLNRGWTKTAVLVERPEPVTGLTERTWEKKFAPGVDFLAGGALAATLCVGASFFCRKKSGLPGGATP